MNNSRTPQHVIERELDILQMIQAQHGTMSDLVDLVRSQIVNGVMFSGSVTIPAGGVWSHSFTAPYAYLLLASTPLAAGSVGLTVTNAPNSGAAPAAGIGVKHVAAFASAGFNMVGSTVTVYGTPGDTFDLEIHARPQTPQRSGVTVTGQQVGTLVITASQLVTVPMWATVAEIYVLGGGAGGAGGGSALTAGGITNQVGGAGGTQGFCAGPDIYPVSSGAVLTAVVGNGGAGGAGGAINGQAGSASGAGTFSSLTGPGLSVAALGALSSSASLGNSSIPATTVGGYGYPGHVVTSLGAAALGAASTSLPGGAIGLGSSGGGGGGPANGTNGGAGGASGLPTGTNPGWAGFPAAGAAPDANGTTGTAAVANSGAGGGGGGGGAPGGAGGAGANGGSGLIIIRWSAA